jgi:ribosomal protein S25
MAALHVVACLVKRSEVQRHGITLDVVDALVKLYALNVLHAVKARYGQEMRGKITIMGRSPERPSVVIEADMRKRVAAGEWQSGEQLPSVAALAARYGVAGGTIARVLRKLADDGLVRVVPGWGTFRM